MTMTFPFDTDVLIVGAGPVGLFLANECARRGLRFQIVEKRSAQSEHSKALAIFPRTLEIFDMAGVVAPFLERANRVTSVSISSHGRTLAHMQFTPHESPYPFIAMVPQDVTEKLLVDALQQKRGKVEYDTSFLSAVQHKDHVVATLDHKGEKRDVTAKYVVGCDGAHSAVRHFLNLPFAGAQYEDLFLLADAETNTSLPGDELQLCPSEAGPVAVFPMSDTRRRIVATVRQQEGEAPSLEMVRKIAAERGPAGLEIRELHWSSYFRIHHRQVAKLRVNRMFVAGDAAHIHSPFGGQGMNTGLQDVWNLAWKLDQVVHQYAADSLLDTYSDERRPVIKGVIETTDFLTKAMATPNRVAQALRDAIIPMVSRLAPFQHAFVQRLSELGISYQGSPIIEGAGKRYLDDSMRGGDGIRSHFLLLVGESTEASIKQAASRLAGSFPDILELRRRPGDEVILVRPDGYTAFSARNAEGAKNLDSIRLLLERHAHSRLVA